MQGWELVRGVDMRKTDTSSWYVNRMNAVLNLENLTHSEHHVAMVLCSHMNGDGEAWMSVATLAGECKRHHKTVRKLLAGIRKAGVFVKDGRVRGLCPIYVEGPSLWGTGVRSAGKATRGSPAFQSSTLPGNAAPKDKRRAKGRTTSPSPSKEGNPEVEDLVVKICSHLNDWTASPFPGLGDIEHMLDAHELQGIRERAESDWAEDQQGKRPSSLLDPTSEHHTTYWAQVLGTGRRHRDHERLRAAMRLAQSRAATPAGSRL